MLKDIIWTVGLYVLPGTDMDSYVGWVREHMPQHTLQLIIANQRISKFDLVIIPHFEGYDVSRAAFFSPKQIVPQSYEGPNSLVKFMCEGFPVGGYSSDLEYYCDKTLVLAEGHAACAVVDYIHKEKLYLQNGAIKHKSSISPINMGGEDVYVGDQILIDRIPFTASFARFLESQLEKREEFVGIDAGNDNFETEPTYE
jgi:hypothetical protein